MLPNWEGLWHPGAGSWNGLSEFYVLTKVAPYRAVGTSDADGALSLASGWVWRWTFRNNARVLDKLARDLMSRIAQASRDTSKMGCWRTAILGEPSAATYAHRLLEPRFSPMTVHIEGRRNHSGWTQLGLGPVLKVLCYCRVDKETISLILKFGLTVRVWNFAKL